MDYNKLRTFIEVAKTGSISKAANNLYRTQPAITQQIQILEESLELTLLERRNTRIFLTKQGEQLYKYARHRLREIDDYLAEIKNDSESLTGEIRIGIRPDVATYMLPIVFANFKISFPNVKFTIIHGDASQTEERILSNQVDIGIQLLVENKKLLKTWPAKSRPIILVAGAEYLKDRGTPKKPVDLLDHDVIDYTEDCDALAYWSIKADKSLQSSIRKKRPNYICPDHGFAAELVKKNLGIGLLPIYTVEEELKTGSIKEVLAQKGRDYSMSFDIVVKKNANHTAAEAAFLEAMKRELCH